MKERAVHTLLTYSIAAVWLINGLLCKVLNLVERHELIVAKVMGDEFSRPLTLLIGLAEIGMALWVLTGIKSRLNAVIQITVVAAMNILEFVLAPDLLLWGQLNAGFAFVFILIVYYNEFHLNKALAQQS
ncbi:DoxX-like family protein [Pontibacter ruber]|uniref:DoxX-like family protein n=1 Tax=Pontibacter ruber TaxID=1343895 RepID=A0ABW5CX23_9BACT|nr:DoxX-like family protein [Pontibacter ruber]